MNLVLQRGLFTSPDRRDPHLVQWLQPGARNPEAGLCFIRKASGQVEAYAAKAGVMYPMPSVARSSAGVTVEWQGWTLHAGLHPWHALPPIDQFLILRASRWAYLPLQAWVDEQWYDGPLLVGAGQELRSFVLAGSPGYLTLDAHPDLAPKVPFVDLATLSKKARGQSWKASLAQSLSLRWREPPPGFIVHVKAWTAREAAALIALRAAFPDTFCYWEQSGARLSPPWKRLAQNLNISFSPHERTFLDSRSIPFFATDFCLNDQDNVLMTFLKCVQETVPVLPAKLFLTLTKD